MLFFFFARAGGCSRCPEPTAAPVSRLQVGKPSKSKHNVLPSGSLQFLSLSKEDHGEWECVATNVVTSITASTRILVIGIKRSAHRSAPLSQPNGTPLWLFSGCSHSSVLCGHRFKNTSPLRSVPLGVIKISLDLICNSLI